MPCFNKQNEAFRERCYLIVDRHTYLEQQRGFGFMNSSSDLK